MDRFIDPSGLQIILIDGDLKSNMDRFIEIINRVEQDDLFNLKSNMDRFIAFYLSRTIFLNCYLKSNMDRFIV